MCSTTEKRFHPDKKCKLGAELWNVFVHHRGGFSLFLRVLNVPCDVKLRRDLKIKDKKQSMHLKCAETHRLSCVRMISSSGAPTVSTTRCVSQCV